MSKSKVNATVVMNSESCIRDIQKFNTLAGNEFKFRPLTDLSVVLQADIITEEFAEFEDAWGFQDKEQIVKEVGDIVVVAIGMMHKMGVDPVEVMKEINNSNLSKFADKEQEADESVKYWQGQGRYENVYWEKVGDKYIIFGNPVGSDGFKILKSLNYTHADISKLMEE